APAPAAPAPAPALPEAAAPPVAAGAALDAVGVAPPAEGPALPPPPVGVSPAPSSTFFAPSVFGADGTGTGRLSADLASCSALIEWYISKPMNVTNLYVMYGANAAMNISTTPAMGSL